MLKFFQQNIFWKNKLLNGQSKKCWIYRYKYLCNPIKSDRVTIFQMNKSRECPQRGKRETKGLHFVDIHAGSDLVEKRAEILLLETTSIFLLED